MTDSFRVELHDITKRFGDYVAVDDLTLQVRDGEFFSLIGPSGCGKTTTLRMIAGFEQPTDGHIYLGSQAVQGIPAHNRPVNTVFQNYALFPHMTVAQNVAFGLEMQKVTAPEIKRRVAEALELVRLPRMADRKPRQLSGGQQQRVALARALVIEPAVLLFDEPLSNLDARLRRSMREEIRSLQQRLGLTVAYVTHDQSEALAVSDQIIVMDAGQIAQAGAPQDLYERPATAFVAGFMGEAMLFDGVSEPDGSVRFGPIRLQPRHRLPAGPVKAAIRPEAWSIGPREAGGLGGELLKQAYLGSFQELTVQTELGPIFVVSPQVDREWRLGEELGLTLKDHGVTVVGA